MIAFDNLDEFIADADRALRAQAALAADALEQLAETIATDERANAPAPRTGSRAATIHVTKGPEGAGAVRGAGGRFVSAAKLTVIDVGPTAKAFSLVFDEFGASNVPAKPWARPAIESAWAGWRPW